MAGEPFPIDLGDPDLRAALLKSLRQRVPAADVEDVVQATLIEALASKQRPADAESARRWLWGIARHKVADLHRKGRREVSDEGVEGESEEAPHDATDLMRWAEDQLPEGEDAPQTFEWLLREGDGDKLEHIADEADLPAPRVRQRVSRLRKHLRSRWALEVAAVATLLGVVGLIVWQLTKTRHNPEEDRIVRDVPSATTFPPFPPPPYEQARELREAALPKCARDDRTGCLEGLDEAKRLDPAGDLLPEVQAARRRFAPAPAPSASVPAVPSTLTLPPRPTSTVPPRTTPPMSTEAPPAPPTPQKIPTKANDSFGSLDSGSSEGSSTTATKRAPVGKK